MKRLDFYVHIFFRSCICLSIATIMASCEGRTKSLDSGKPISVDFLSVKPTAVVLEQKYLGSLEGAVDVDVKSQVSGYLDCVYVNEGDYVKKGQLLFKIRSDVYNEQVNSSKATLTAAIAAQNSARLEVEKIRSLVYGKVVSEMQLKTAEANYESAAAQVAEAKATLGTSRLNAAFCLIKAPVSGYIGRIPNRIGNLITPSDATPLTTLSAIDKVFVYFSISEADFLSIRSEEKAHKSVNSVGLIMANGAVYGQKGTLESASGNIDRSTGCMTMKAVFFNPDKQLRSGGTVRIILKKISNAALAIPMGSVKEIQDKYFVFLLKGKNRVAMRPIEIAGKTDSSYIVRRGLNADDKIAINSIDLLNESVLVTPQFITSK